MNASWVIPFIILGGALQSCGAAMNSQLNKSIVNPWRASAISFTLITFFFFFLGAVLIMPRPLPTAKDILSMPWWAVIGGLVGAVQVYAGLTLVTKVGAGLFVAFTVTASAPHVIGDRSLRMVPYGSPPFEHLEIAGWAAARRRRHPHSQVLKARQWLL
jgi:transporter family-2 protein